MIVALYAVAMAMIIGGAAALSQGYGIISIERGWTLVIAGVVAVGSGAVLAGIAHVAHRIAAIQADVARLRERFARLDPAALPAAPTIGADALAPAPRGLSELPPVTPGDTEPAPERETDLRSPAPSAGTARPQVRREPVVTPLLREVPLRGAASEPVAEPSEADEPAPAAEEPSSDAPSERTVVGTYDSGGNHYVMFSDGSIEAETPKGVFRFKSLEELKAFIASGGEAGAGAA